MDIRGTRFRRGRRTPWRSLVHLDLAALHACGDEGQRVLRSLGLEQSPHVGRIGDLRVAGEVNHLGPHGLQLDAVLVERGDVLLLELDQLRRGDLDALLCFAASPALLVKGETDRSVFMLELGSLSRVDEHRLGARPTFLLKGLAQRAELLFELGDPGRRGSNLVEGTGYSAELVDRGRSLLLRGEPG